MISVSPYARVPDIRVVVIKWTYGRLNFSSYQQKHVSHLLKSEGGQVNLRQRSVQDPLGLQAYKHEKGYNGHSKKQPSKGTNGAGEVLLCT